ncbi:hypothetical protein KC19_10G036900 [Ceratodon purpureus]|uniref:FAD-binding FR-type domain-containing protein n=1 Tax=Ceratodon purpureus TaxID=3225 RepID=A0A8T0GNE8_CERPU|nr:hypothetical protein KC19_10G036900 [Ceratodon purpureus]
MATSDGDLTVELLRKRETDKNASQEVGMGTVAVRWALWLPMCLFVGMYLAFLIVWPMASLEKIRTVLLFSAVGKFGIDGGILILFGAPFLLLTIFAILILEVDSRIAAKKGKARGRARLQEQPMVTESLMGMISVAELLWILFFLALFVWMMANYMVTDFKRAEVEKLEPYESVWGVKLKLTGLRLGFIGIVCLNLLFLPVARGSVLLRAIDIPFEHAAKYHVWLGHFMMAVFTLHGLFYMVAWYFEGHLIERILEWPAHEIANLPGLIALLAGIAMWVTSFGWVRNKYNFELFFYTHQLYIVFVVFMAFHVGDFIFNMCFAGLFLFTFDRFLRFCQSRSNTGILSSKLLPCGTYELVIAKPQGMKYHALSFIFLNVPGISALQWHPFSVSSSPYDGDDRLKVLIKPYGEWTHQLQDEVIAAVKPGPCPFAIKAAVEGPYGHESDYFLHYETLILVAGGIGVSPFVAILRDLLHRYQRGQPNLPSDVTLIWAVQKSEELQLLDLVSASTICPDYNQKLNLHVHAFVTRETQPRTLEQAPETSDSNMPDHFKKSRILSSLTNVEASKQPLSILVGTGSNFWISAGLLASLLGYICASILVARYVVEPHEKRGVGAPEFGTGIPLWAKGFFNFMNMVLGVVVFGGAVFALWSYFGNRGSSAVDDEGSRMLLDSDDDGTTLANESGDRLVHPSNTQFGHRPNLRELFEGCAKRQSPGTNVGVMICGPETLQTSVAETCRSFNTVDYKPHKVAFSYHSVSFDL